MEANFFKRMNKPFKRFHEPFKRIWTDSKRFRSLNSGVIAELTEFSPIIIQNSGNPSSRKNLDLRPYDHATVQDASFNMRGQLYRGHTNTTALFSSLFVSALSSESDDQGSSPGWGKVSCPWDVRGKKMRAPLLGLAKSMYYSCFYLVIYLILRSLNPQIPLLNTDGKNAHSLWLAYMPGQVSNCNWKSKMCEV